jgi:hypothetical protein
MSPGGMRRAGMDREAMMAKIVRRERVRGGDTRVSRSGGGSGRSETGVSVQRAMNGILLRLLLLEQVLTGIRQRVCRVRRMI